MARDIINPKDTTAILQLNAVINELDTNVGFIMNSGLFTEELTPRDTIVEQINKQDKRGMLGLTSRRERNKVKQTRRETEAWSIQIPYQETIEDVTKEDVFQVAKDWETATEDQVMDVYERKLVPMKESIENAREYMYWTAAQGRTRNPKNGNVILDMFAKTGVTRPVINIDLTDMSLNLLVLMGEIRNRVMRDNKRGSSQGIIEIFVTQDVFTKWVSHPSVIAAYQMAYQGRGKEFIDTVARPFGTLSRGAYGLVSEFEHDGVRLIVAPQTFILEDGDIYDDGTYDEVPAVEKDSGFAVVRGVRDAFRAQFSQSNDLMGGGLAKVYAWRSEIKDNAYFEMTASSAPMAYTTAPELCYEFKFKTA
ncbi:major head protein [Acinetobacter phage vB_AbaM_KissB]|uniref:major capsid protein n=1 Tax=Acinetobacter phage vB_AbaM_phiAbaA1 TaxID=1605379 RepID=UPI00078D4A8D|nr:major capsid protein [Acinetobacter phage vB_AbaM_phiAbaA1]AJK27134.1 major capsid protein [Acinetobacter phage vB_AbaM_phiAbaA1]